MNTQRSSESDGTVPGLTLRTDRSGQRWYLFYRTTAGRKRNLKLGDRSILSRAQARDLARKTLASVAAGNDPAEARQTNVPTIQDLHDRYRDEQPDQVKPRTWATCYAPIWNNHILPALGRRTVASVGRQDIVDLHVAMRDAPYQANRMLSVMHRAMELAETRWGWRPLNSNPVKVERYPETKRRRFPDGEEVIRLFDALNRMRPTEPIFVGFIELLIATGCRAGEILTARRDWVKPDGLHLPDSKGGARIVPLNQQARDVIARIPAIADSPWLIPGRVHGEHMTMPKLRWNDLLAEAGIEGLRRHDLRRFFASAALSAGVTLDQVGQLLGHQQVSTTRRYAYLMTDSATAASERAWLAVLARSVPKDPETGNLVLRRHA